MVTSLAVHHVTDERKRTLYAEVAGRLTPGGVFANLDIVASPTPALHDRWRDEMGARDDPTDILCAMTDQLEWIAEAGLQNVDCIWKWRSLALDARQSGRDRACHLAAPLVSARRRSR